MPIASAKILALIKTFCPTANLTTPHPRTIQAPLKMKVHSKYSILMVIELRLPVSESSTGSQNFMPPWPQHYVNY